MKKKVKYYLSFDVGDTVWNRFGKSFVVQTIEIYKNSIVYRCGNKDTSDYWSFFEEEVGTRAFSTKEEQEEALRREDGDARKQLRF